MNFLDIMFYQTVKEILLLGARNHVLKSSGKSDQMIESLIHLVKFITIQNVVNGVELSGIKLKNRFL